MALLDWILLATLLASSLLGAWRGLVYEVISLLGWVAAFVVAQWLAPSVALALPLAGLSELLRYAAAFVLCFVAALFAAGLLAWLVRKLVEGVGLRPIDRVLGWLFGLARGVLILLLLAVVVRWTPWHTQPVWTQSHGAGWLDATVNHLRPVIPQSLARYLAD
jgi:membrane protein required for colicin V production